LSDESVPNQVTAHQQAMQKNQQLVPTRQSMKSCHHLPLLYRLLTPNSHPTLTLHQRPMTLSWQESHCLLLLLLPLLPLRLLLPLPLLVASASLVGSEQRCWLETLLGSG